ncbi:hypothetical protein, partial [Chryseobacterium sp. CH1]|uniref:hypothetical protein n=1 Tax=Chryseobacterium sp. CH1 TaxID=713551 RepID=UPI0010257664
KSGTVLLNPNGSVSGVKDRETDNFSGITWNKAVSHYKFGDYAAATCELDENEYTILFTPKKSGTVLLNPNGSVSGVKDRETDNFSGITWNKA